MEVRFLKLTNAVYSALGFFPESDPLKNRAKEKVLSIMDNLVLIFAKDSRAGRAEQVLEDIEMLMNYLMVAQSQGWLNNTNCLIICNEYEKIKEEINQAMPAKPAPTEKKIVLSERQKKILKFLQENNKAQVMDLKLFLPDVTKRTIRRDLDELLKLGKIVRIGEWNQVFYKIVISAGSGTG